LPSSKHRSIRQRLKATKSSVSTGTDCGALLRKYFTSVGFNALRAIIR
jgi:hypothetical protein